MSDTDETCANCGCDVDKEPVALCDECEGDLDVTAIRADAASKERARVVVAIVADLIALADFHLDHAKHCDPVSAAMEMKANLVLRRAALNYERGEWEVRE